MGWIRLGAAGWELQELPLPIHVIYPHARLLSSNVRAFVDWTVPRLRKRLKQL